MSEDVTAVRCGYTTLRGRAYGNRVAILIEGHPQLYMNAPTYDRIDDEAFERFMTAWRAGNYAEIQVALGLPDPRDGLKHLAEANEAERRKQAKATMEA